MTEGNSSEENPKIEGKTPHGEQRSQEAQAGDATRQVGDVNRVVIVDPATKQQITQFKNSKANTQKRIESGRWKPIL